MNGPYELAKLRTFLKTRGTDMVLISSKTGLKTTIRAKRTGYTPNELVGAMSQQDSVLIVSPDALNGYLPVKGDTIRDHGANATVQAASAVRMGETVVRVWVAIRGAAS